MSNQVSAEWGRSVIEVVGLMESLPKDESISGVFNIASDAHLSFLLLFSMSFFY